MSAASRLARLIKNHLKPKKLPMKQKMINRAIRNSKGSAFTATKRATEKWSAGRRKRMRRNAIRRARSLIKDRQPDHCQLPQVVRDYHQPLRNNINTQTEP